MSRPTDEQAEQLIERVRSQFQEWDEGYHMLFIWTEDGNMVGGGFSTARQMFVMAQSLIDMGIKQADIEHDQEEEDDDEDPI